MNSLELLMLLAHRGHPLHVTLAPDANGGTIVHRDDASITVARVNPEHMENILRRALRHYPDTVTLQGQPVTTTPFPDLARVFLQSNNPGADPHETSRELVLEPHPREETTGIPHPGQTQAMAAGIMWTVDHQARPPETLLGPDSLQQPQPYNWAHLQTITLVMVPNLDADELELMTTNDRGTPSVPPNSDLAARVEQRCLDQTQRTLDHPAMPQVHQGPVHGYALRESRDQDTMEEDQHVPIAVHGTPVILPQETPDGHPLLPSQYVSAAEALYRADSPFVPVAPGRPAQSAETRPETQVEAITFSVNPMDGETPRPAEGVRLVRAITMSFTIQGDPRTHRVDTPMLFQDHPFQDRDIALLPDPATASDLEDCIMRAYWDEGSMEFHDWDDLKVQRSDMIQDIHDMVAAVMGDPEEGFRRQLQRHLLHFYPKTPWPDREVSATSHDGRLTVTVHPQKPG